MIKKVLIAGLFLGGGIYAIRKLLPKFQKQEYKADIQDYEVKRFYSNPTGRGGNINESLTRNSLPFNTLREAGQGNNWDIDPSDREEGGRIKGLVAGVAAADRIGPLRGGKKSGNHTISKAQR